MFNSLDNVPCPFQVYVAVFAARGNGIAFAPAVPNVDGDAVCFIANGQIFLTLTPGGVEAIGRELREDKVRVITGQDRRDHGKVSLRPTLENRFGILLTLFFRNVPQIGFLCWSLRSDVERVNRQNARLRLERVRLRAMLGAIGRQRRRVQDKADLIPGFLFETPGSRAEDLGKDSGINRPGVDCFNQPQNPARLPPSVVNAQPVVFAAEVFEQPSRALDEWGSVSGKLGIKRKLRADFQHRRDEKRLRPRAFKKMTPLRDLFGFRIAARPEIAGPARLRKEPGG